MLSQQKMENVVKSLLRNYLQQQSPEKLTKDPPAAIQSSVVDAMRVVRLIPITGASSPPFLPWAKRVFRYLEALPGEILHIVFDDYSPVGDPTKVLSNGRANKGKERKIAYLNQVLPKTNEWQDFLTNDKSKYQICSFSISSGITTNKTIYVTKERQCFVKRVAEPWQPIRELFSNHREADHRYNLYLTNSRTKVMLKF